jgi:hypothetical protein
VTAVQVPGTAQPTTSTWTLGATVENLGQADAGASTLEYRLSRDATLDAGDTLIGTSQVPALPVGAAPHVDTYSTSFSISAPGRYWIFATARLVTPVEEMDTVNNSRSAGVSIIYGTLIVDTYVPNPLMSFSPRTGIELFGPTGTAAPIASVSAGSADYARLTYTGPLEPGTYYIRITGLSYGAYAVRTLTALPVPEYSAADYFDVVNNPDPYEVNDTLVGGVPVPPLATTLGDRTNRYLGSPADQDWIQVVLP